MLVRSNRASRYMRDKKERGRWCGGHAAIILEGKNKGKTIKYLQMVKRKQKVAKGDGEELHK